MRVTLVTHYFPGHRGGVELVAWEIASRLARARFADIVWHASATDEPPDDEPGLQFEPARACNAIEDRLGVPFPVWSPAALLRVARAARTAEVVHIHDFFYLPNLVAWATARLSGRRVVVTQHIGSIAYRNPALRMALAAANRLLGRLVLGSATQTVFVSRPVLEYFSRFVRFRRPPLFVPNGVDGQMFRFADEAQRRALRARLGQEAERPLILFVGRFVEKKGLAILRTLAASVPAARWIFVGRGPMDPAGWGLENVSVRGSLSRKELVPLYQAADLLVLPSFGEGFPLVVQEAMACGTPALVSDDTAAAYPEAAGILLSEPLGPGDPAARWSERIRRLISAPAALRALREQVARFARDNWSWERCVARYAEVLRSCGS